MMMNEIETLKSAQRQVAAIAIKQAIADPGEFDDWRKSELSIALNHLDSGWYGLADFHAEKALYPLGVRVPFIADDEQIRLLTRKSLGDQLYRVLGLPVRLR